MFLKVFLVVFLLLIVYLLLVPIVLFIDTDTNTYYIKLKGLATASIEKHELEIIRIKLKIPFYQFYYYPFKKKSSLIQKKLVKRGKVNRWKRMRIQKIVRMLRSFKVKRFMIDIDTGNCITNAKLFPIFGFLNYQIGIFNINFEGRNRMALHLENRPIYIIRSFIKT